MGADVGDTEQPAASTHQQDAHIPRASAAKRALMEIGGGSDLHRVRRSFGKRQVIDHRSRAEDQMAS
jgi:hypothetical protein